MDKELKQNIEASIPQHMQPGLIAYIEDGQPPGGFLRAVLENKLYHAFAKGDDLNQSIMIEYARILEQIPTRAWGSKEAVDEWINIHGLNGLIGKS